MGSYENNPIRINFYHHKERLVEVGSNDSHVRSCGKRREVFLIAEDEKLIGCKLDEHSWKKFGFQGVTWIKMKVRRF